MFGFRREKLFQKNGRLFSKEDSSIKIIKDSIMDQSCVNHIKLHLTENLCHIGRIAPTWEKTTGGTITPARSLGTFQNLSYQQTSLRMMTDASC